MKDSRWRIQVPGLQLFEHMLRLYPPRFRHEFSAEIRLILMTRMHEAEDRGLSDWFITGLQEFTGLIISIFRERWHEIKVRKERTMVPEDQIQKDVGAAGGGMPAFRLAGTPGVLWFCGWTLLTTAAIPAAIIAMPPIAAMFMWLINLGGKAGLWPSVHASTLESLGFLTSLALMLGSAQWYLLRKLLPHAWLWFIATGAGILIGGLVLWVSLQVLSAQWRNPIWIMVAVLLPFGLALGLTQWLHLRKFLPNAIWIIFINLLATASISIILLVGQSFNSLAQLLIALTLPGAITGVGLWLLLRQARLKIPYQAQIEAVLEKNKRWLPRLAWTGLGMAALVPLFFLCIWVYAASQLALAKNEGIYATPEEAIIATNSRGFGGAKVIRVENVHAGPNRHDGTQPHVWFGGATVYFDKAPEGYTWDHYQTGSYYIHVKDGWVFVGEGAFPEFIGWVMELYHMEGVV